MNTPINWIDILLQVGPIAIRGFQRALKWGINRIKWRGISEDARKIAFAIHSFSWANLQQSAPTINRVGLINRPEIEQILKIWDSSESPVLLHGEAGTGKSGIALRLGQTLSNIGIPVLFLRATDFPYGQEPVAIIQNRMALDRPIMDALAKLSRERKFAVIVDQLDTVAGTDLGKTFTSFLKSIAGIQNVNILAVTRSYELMHDPDISALGFQTIESGHLTNEQALDYLARLELMSPPSRIVELASNLLNLSLIADVVSITPRQTQEIIDEVELWKQFFVTIQQREGDDTAEFALHLARDVTKKGQRHFSIQLPNIRLRQKLLSRAILVALPGRQFAFRHEQLQDFLCAYSLLPEQPTIPQILSEFGSMVPKGVMYWLHLLYHAECPEVEPALVDSILASKKQIAFYVRTQILENLQKQIVPNQKVAAILPDHFQEWAYQRFFFEGLENPAWIVPLYQSGFFHQLPGPIQVQPGSFQLPGWPAGEYLVRFADQYENIVTDIIQTTQTDNWRVQEILVDAMLKGTPSVVTELISSIDSWLDGRFSDMLPNKLLTLADYLTKAKFHKAAIQLLESVITPVLQPATSEYSKYRSPVRFRSDHYWVNEYCEKQLPTLRNIDPLGIVKAFERQLLRTIELVKQTNPHDAEMQVGYFWRMDIPNRLSERSDADALDILVDGVRDGLTEVCKHSIQDGEKIIESYFSGEHLIFQRIALHVLRWYGQNYPALLKQVFSRRDFLEDARYSSDYRSLLRNQFDNTSEEIQLQVITWIISGPSDVDSRAIRHAQWENREATDDDRCKVREKWTLYHLEIIRNFLPREALELLDKLTVVYGKPDTDERPHIVTTSWEGIPSPVSAEELAKKSLDELEQLLLTYVPEDLLLNPREGLAQTLRKIVRDDPARYSTFASYLTDPSIRFVYVDQYLAGIRESIKEQVGKLDDAIISLCEYVVAQKEDPLNNSSGHDEPGLFASQMQVAHLLEEALRSDDPYLTREQLDRIRSLLIILANHTNPREDDEINNSLDPFTHSLNCVRGQAMHGIIHYSLYLVRWQEKINDEKTREGFLEPEIKEILEKKLDVSIEPSLAVHSVYGAFVPQLHYLARDWLEEQLEAIFPVDKEKFTYWKAAWDAYIFLSNVYQDVFRLLVPQYQQGIQLLGQVQDGQKHFGGAPNERLAQHLMYAYLSGLTDFGHENSLLDSFFIYAPDPFRANGVFWLSKVLETQKPTADDLVWKKCWELWQERLINAEAQEISQNTQEISQYTRWLQNCPVDLEYLYPTLCQMVKYLHDGFHARQLASYIAEHCERSPLEAVSLLQMIIISAKESWWTPEDKDEEKILHMAITSGNDNARQIAREVINYRGERGDFRWKQLLD